jgi:hypothetical protein
MKSILAALTICALAFSQDTAVPDMKSVHKVFIEPMPNGLDQYLRAEFNKLVAGMP